MIQTSPFPLEKIWIRERGRIDPDKIAVIDGSENVTFQKLLERASSRADQLKKLGVLQGDVIGAFLPNTLFAVEIFHAVHLCRATLLPLNLRLTASEINFQINETRAKILIAGEEDLISLASEVSENSEFSPRLVIDSEDNQLVWLDAGEQFSAPGKDGLGEMEHAEDVPWVILYTSGTTGTPKGVPLTARHLGASAMASLAHLGVLREDRWLACVPLFHIAGLSILTRSVLAGSTVILHKNFDANKVSQAVDEQRVTLMSLVPTMLHRLVDARLADSRKTVLSLRAILVGGAACSDALRQQSLELGLPVLRTYGLTEACSQVATESYPPDHHKKSEPPTSLQGIQVRIVDTFGKTRAAGEEGEILVRGAMVMDHYYKRVNESQKALQDGWLHTGDIGFLNDQGGLCVLNRRSDLIVTGGENVYPVEVEACLSSHPGVEEACVTGEDDLEFGQRVVAWVVLKQDSDAGEVELQKYCRRSLAGYKIPRSIMFLQQLPRNVSGKIMRQSLKLSLS